MHKIFKDILIFTALTTVTYLIINNLTSISHEDVIFSTRHGCLAGKDMLACFGGRMEYMQDGIEGLERYYQKVFIDGFNGQHQGKIQQEFDNSTSDSEPEALISQPVQVNQYKELTEQSKKSTQDNQQNQQMAVQSLSTSTQASLSSSQAQKLPPLSTQSQILKQQQKEDNQQNKSEIKLEEENMEFESGLIEDSKHLQPLNNEAKQQNEEGKSETLQQNNDQVESELVETDQHTAAGQSNNIEPVERVEEKSLQHQKPNNDQPSPKPQQQSIRQENEINTAIQQHNQLNQQTIAQSLTQQNIKQQKFQQKGSHESEQKIIDESKYTQKLLQPNSGDTKSQEGIHHQPILNGDEGNKPIQNIVEVEPESILEQSVTKQKQDELQKLETNEDNHRAEIGAAQMEQKKEQIQIHQKVQQVQSSVQISSEQKLNENKVQMPLTAQVQIGQPDTNEDHLTQISQSLQKTQQSQKTQSPTQSVEQTSPTQTSGSQPASISEQSPPQTSEQVSPQSSTQTVAQTSEQASEQQQQVEKIENQIQAKANQQEQQTITQAEVGLSEHRQWTGKESEGIQIQYGLSSFEDFGNIQQFQQNDLRDFEESSIDNTWQHQNIDQPPQNTPTQASSITTQYQPQQPSPHHRQNSLDSADSRHPHKHKQQSNIQQNISQQNKKQSTTQQQNQQKIEIRNQEQYNIITDKVEVEGQEEGKLEDGEFEDNREL